jgi:hypothetical protein
MSFRERWSKSNLLAKSLTVSATLLILQIGLCFSTPYAASLFSDSRDPFDALGWMMLEAILCVCTFIFLFVAWLRWLNRPKGLRSKKKDSDD